MKSRMEFYSVSQCVGESPLDKFEERSATPFYGLLAAINIQVNVDPSALSLRKALAMASQVGLDGAS